MRFAAETMPVHPLRAHLVEDLQGAPLTLACVDNDGAVRVHRDLHEVHLVVVAVLLVEGLEALDQLGVGRVVLPSFTTATASTGPASTSSAGDGRGARRPAAAAARRRGGQMQRT